jgi:glycosyltransferase involved in cell wall biosynthesis
LRLAIYHGYELSGSGSNEYTRYLARTLAALGHHVALICHEPNPAVFRFVSRASSYSIEGEPRLLFRRDGDGPGSVALHQLPRTSCSPVYLKDKQRAGNVKAFPELTAAELNEYHAAGAAVVARALRDDRCELLHVNHLVYQPRIALDACRHAGVPFYIVPHGSSIEYTVRRDSRYVDAARRAIEGSTGLVWISREVRDRVLDLFPDLRSGILDKSRSVGVGTDTSLFQPLAPDERPGAFSELAATHARGGKTAEQRAELRRLLDGGEIDAVRRYRDAYDHGLPDDDLPAMMERIPSGDDLLLFVGALTCGKGVQSLIAAMPAILEKNPSAHLLIVGSGSYREVLEALTHALDNGDEELFDRLVSAGRELERDAGSGPLEDLKSYAAEAVNRKCLFGGKRRLSRHVHFLGRLDHARLRWLFPCCRLALVPSIVKEASPLVFYEALANGVLPAGSYHSGLRDGLDELRPLLPGAVWERMKLPADPARRVAGIAESVLGLLGDEATARLGSRLRRLAEQRYDWKAVAATLVEAVSWWAAERHGWRGSCLG